MSCSDKLSQAKGMFWATVLSNQQIRTCYNRIIIELGADAVPFFQSVIPGQFVMLDLTQTALPAQEKIRMPSKTP
jgi:hypothetical protein